MARPHSLRSPKSVMDCCPINLMRVNLRSPLQSDRLFLSIKTLNLFFWLARKNTVVSIQSVGLELDKLVSEPSFIERLTSPPCLLQIVERSIVRQLDRHIDTPCSSIPTPLPKTASMSESGCCQERRLPENSRPRALRRGGESVPCEEDMEVGPALLASNHAYAEGAANIVMNSGLGGKGPVRRGRYCMLRGQDCSPASPMGSYAAKARRTASSSCSITLSRIRAAPSGRRRPCSRL